MRFLVDLFVRILFISVDIMCFVFVSKFSNMVYIRLKANIFRFEATPKVYMNEA